MINVWTCTKSNVLDTFVYFRLCLANYISIAVKRNDGSGCKFNYSISAWKEQFWIIRSGQLCCMDVLRSRYTFLTKVRWISTVLFSWNAILHLQNSVSVNICLQIWPLLWSHKSNRFISGHRTAVAHYWRSATWTFRARTSCHIIDYSFGNKCNNTIV